VALAPGSSCPCGGGCPVLRGGAGQEKRRGSGGAVGRWHGGSFEHRGGLCCAATAGGCAARGDRPDTAG
ncbi:unnamed protein product, partial [Symbiodinium microadriaticum]